MNCKCEWNKGRRKGHNYKSMNQLNDLLDFCKFVVVAVVVVDCNALSSKLVAVADSDVVPLAVAVQRIQDNYSVDDTFVKDWVLVIVDSKWV